MSQIEKVSGVSVIHWNPRHAIGSNRLTRQIRIGRRTNNFGDLLGPLVTRQLARPVEPSPRTRGARLLTVGSILHFARTNDSVWGTGVNGKVPVSLHAFESLDVRAVRGPKTRKFLTERGIQVPEVYGDPALLLPRLRPDLLGSREQSDKPETLIVPNLHDYRSQSLSALGPVLDPTSDLEFCLRSILNSELVISSSLHGLIIAEAFGIPAVFVQSAHENPFKYEDYFEGTGRSAVPASPSFHRAMSDGQTTPSMTWRAEELLDAFPQDLWEDRRR